MSVESTDDIDDVDGLYLLASDNVPGANRFYLTIDEAVEEKEELEGKYPPEELNLVIFKVSDLEEVEE